jgi:hypothetical protein
MRTKRIIYAFILFALILTSACATVTRESGLEPPEKIECLNTSDCPAGFRCDPRTRTCVRAY